MHIYRRLVSQDIRESAFFSGNALTAGNSEVKIAVILGGTVIGAL